MDWRWIHLSVFIVAVCTLLAPAVPAGEPEPNVIVIDDFESYDDMEGMGTRIYETWIDGYTDNLSGSIVGSLNPDELYPIHAGYQVMPFEYDNVSPPYYSQTYRTWDTPQDWTVDHVADLSLWLRGKLCLFLAQPDGRIVMSVPPADVAAWPFGVFSFGYRQLDGDGAILAKVESIETAAGTGGAGVMMGRALDGYLLQYVAVVVTMDRRLVLESCLTPDGKRIMYDAEVLAVPHWVKLVRTGDIFTAQHSADGVNWLDVMDSSGKPRVIVVAMPPDSHVGLYLAAGASPKISTAQFSSVTFTGRVSGAWQATGSQWGNSRENLYVALEDGDGRIGTAVHPDRAAVNFLEWTEWKIPLHDFSRLGVDLKSVRRMYLRVGDKNARQPGGWGKIYIDDIRLLCRAQAAASYPADREVNVPQSPVLRWSPGGMATHHDIYLGTDPNAVASATPATPNIYRGRQVRTDTTYEPGGLEWNKTWYWRVDEVNEARPESPWKGAVWRFTTADCLVIDDFENWPGPEGDIAAYATWIDGYMDGTSGSLLGNPDPPFAEQAIVHGGRQSLPFDYNNVSEPFYSEIWRKFSPAQDWTVHGGDSLVLFIRGLATNDPAPLYLSVEDSAGTVFTTLHPNAELTRATEWVEWRIPLDRLLSLNLLTMTGFNLHKVARIRLSVGSPEEPVPGGRGRIYLDDIRVIPAAPVPDHATAFYPPDGAVGVPQQTYLQWLAADGIRQHDIYFGTDAAAVAAASPATPGIYRGRHTWWQTLFDPGPLEISQTCYWRVDEVNDTHPESPRRGAVWRFTTADFLNVDDFESYTARERGSRFFETWISGYACPEGCWWEPGYLEYGMVHSGSQSMALDYNNVYEPYWSHNYREFSPLYDWTVPGFDTLVLYVRGRAKNTLEPLYVAVEDAAGKKATLVHPDPQVLRTTAWREWKIPLSSLPGVNMRKVKRLYIGVGDLPNPQPAGAGIVYIDDIRVIQSTP